MSHLGVGDGKVARVWREHGIQPWRVETFNFSTDPELVAKVTDIVGLYLDPPENATVLCVDEKSHIPGIGSRRGDLADAKARTCIRSTTHWLRACSTPC